MKYREQYKWSNIGAMVRNLKLDPQVCTDDFRNRTVVITGATSGIGNAAALKYAAHGADIITINRNEAKSQQLCETLRQYGVDCSYVIADFSRLADIHRAGEYLAKLDRDFSVVIHNAGVYATQQATSADNLDLVFQVDYLSTFILNHYLKDKLIQQQHGRILYVNSEAHRFAVTGLYLDDLDWRKHRYAGWKSYGASKLAQLLSMIKLTEIFAGTGVTVNAMHPGNVKTNSGQNNGPLYKLFKRVMIDSTAKSVDVAAEALYYLGVSSGLDAVTGKFFNLTTVEEPAPPALDRAAAEELWNISTNLSGVES